MLLVRLRWSCSAFRLLGVQSIARDFDLPARFVGAINEQLESETHNDSFDFDSELFDILRRIKATIKRPAGAFKTSVIFQEDRDVAPPRRPFLPVGARRRSITLGRVRERPMRLRARAWVRFDWQNDWRLTKNQIGSQRYHTSRV